jgi:predicted tellurium resistance membrane protein TerC
LHLPRLNVDPPSPRKALIWSIVWTLLGVAFALVFLALQGGAAAGEYLTGFLIEKSLSLDNLFVFAVLFAMLGVDQHDRHKVLVLGIALAIVLRGIFIFVGLAAIDAFHGVTYGLGVLLAITAISVARSGGHDNDPTQSRIMKVVRRVVPDNAPALMLPLVAVAAFDVMFAIDSIPAIFAVTTDTWVVLAANAWSLCGMISLYFLLESALARFRYLHLGLAAILGYVAAKLILVDVWHPPIVLSLAVVVGALAVAAFASFIAERGAPDTAHESARARPGRPQPIPEPE